MTEQTREKQRGKQHLEEAEDNDLENGLITKEDFVKLFKFIKDTPVIQDKIVQINGEDLLTTPQKSSGDGEELLRAP